MTPLLWATLACGAGLLAGFRLALPAAAVVALACAPVLLLVLRGRAVLPLVLAAAGVVAGSLRSQAAASDCRERLADGQRVRVVATVRALPVEGLTSALHAISLTADGLTCGAVAVRVRAASQQQPLLLAAAHGEPPALELHGRWLQHARRNGWPRAPQFAGMLLVDSVRPASADAPVIMDRVRVTQQARLRTLLPARWGLAEAMLLAQKAGLAPETRARWVAAGLVHLLAISGMHVGMIAGGVIALARLAGLPRRRARRVALLVTAAYVLFLGAPSAALRALLQFGLLIGALELQRPAEPFTALAAAALIILFIEPLALLDPGFQLSFAGMIGLIAWRRSIATVLPDRVPEVIRDGIAAGVAASALTTPLAALHFGTASWIGIPASVVAVPVLAAAVALVLAALLVSAVTGLATGLHAWPADMALRVLDAIAGAAAAVPGGHGHLGTPAVLYGLLACAAAVLVRARLRADDDRQPTGSTNATRAAERRRRMLRAAVVGAVAIAVLAWAPLLLRSRAQHLEIHVIDVGQGDAIAVRSPAGRWLLVDTGPRSARFDAGRDRVVPYLLRRGARRIDALLLTHPDADHIGGAEAVLDVFDVGLVIDPGFAAGKDIYIDLLGAARRTELRWIAGRAGQRFVVDGIEVTLLYPLPQLDGARDANDNSVVFRLEFGAFAALFTGDAPQAVEDEIVARHGVALRAVVLKVGHHGSRTSTGETLLRTARPSIALISAGRNNRYGHPNAGVLRRLEEHRVHVVRTDERGSFVVRAHRDGRAEVLAR
jgi:competence protein ComEC